MYKVREVIRRLEGEGWEMDRQRDSHRRFVRPEKPGIGTVSGHPNDDVPAGTWANIQRQAGWR